MGLLDWLKHKNKEEAGEGTAEAEHAAKEPALESLTAPSERDGILSDNAETLMAQETEERDDQDYFDAGIQIHRRDGKVIGYYYQEKQITREQADQIADYLISTGRCLSFEELK